MIIIKLKGGLGNQMFQYACGRALTLRSGESLLLDTSGYEAQLAKETVRHYQLTVFKIEENITAAPGTLTKLRATFDKKILRKFNIGFNQKTLARLTAKAKAGKNVYLDGFWWSEKYFQDAADVIRQEFVLKKGFGAAAQQIAAKIEAAPHSISIHVRRGDYVSGTKTNAYHGTCSKEYYEKAIAYIADHVRNDITLFMVSDDIDWVKENLKFPYPTTYVSGADIKDYEEILLMSKCEHHIIANSSFSWWGAWLNPRKDKIVVAPSRWTNAKVEDSADMIPASWIRI